MFCVDSSESELGILDLIQVFVETLDKCFENVCELDLIFHADAVHHILAELVMGGMVLQTNMSDIMARIEEQNKLVKQEAGISAAPARAVSAVKSMNIPQQIKDIKLPDLPQAIKDLKFWPGQTTNVNNSSTFVDSFVLQRLTSPTSNINPTTALSSLAAYALNPNNNNGNNSSTNNNSLKFANKNLYTSSVTQFLNQSIYEPIEDDDFISSFPSADAIASAFNYDYYQSQSSMDPENCNAFESSNRSGAPKHLADVAEAHEQSLKLFRESFDLSATSREQQNIGESHDPKKKHKKSKKAK